MGVMKIQGDELDNEYLDRWASPLDVRSLLARARARLQTESSSQ